MKSSVDRFILARLEAVGRKPAPEADRRTLLRRVSYDLTGLPPEPDEAVAFEQDESPGAFERVVDRLLDSPHYGEQWGRHWLDVVRYADTAGETADYPVPLAWRYRNYVIDAFNADKSYDEFLREQIAGDILASDATRQRYAECATATGFLAVSRRFGFDSENYHHLTIQDTIDTLGQTVLGLSLGCARCHDHKFDPVSMNDYYALYGIFDSSRYAFPGSEQKQQVRAMLPLLPASESQPRWQAFDAHVAALEAKLERENQPVPKAIIRSLHDVDGDFELQAPAAGGSNGVLVPPWLYQGKIAVTTSAQSPFRHAHPGGRVGVSVPSDAGIYRIAQAIYPVRSSETCDLIHVNLDFRVSPGPVQPSAVHRFWVGAQPKSPAVEVLISADQISLRTGGATERIGTVQEKKWQSLQLALDLRGRTVSGSVGAPGQLTKFTQRPFSACWSGRIDLVVLDAAALPATGAGTKVMLPPIEFDNFAIQESPIPPASTEIAAASELATIGELPDRAKLAAQLRELSGFDGDFEMQEKDRPPADPWGAGPNSIVKVTPRAQSPYHNLFAAGALGIAMPNRGEYDGFGRWLPTVWTAEHTGRLFASFDFRCASKDAGGDGSWRYYVGHGPGNSAAVELFWNGGEFVRRSGDARESVAPIAIGQWYQVQLALDLKARTYRGVIASLKGRTEFDGKMASGWDGTIDHTFIDSFGHRGGVRPALDADNFVIGTAVLAPLGKTEARVGKDDLAARRLKAAAIRQELAAIEKSARAARDELDAALADGPCAMTYGVAEGTPHDVRVQLRGEPERPGALVPRGFIKALGGGPLAADTPGSGRLELAHWLSRPDNPLAARVMVNRIWQYHFGHGLVKTPNDFGVRGLPPSHPELLDHLASGFIRSGWSVKAMHRLLILSSSYQQASLAGADHRDQARSRRTRPICSRLSSGGGSLPRSCATRFSRSAASLIEPRRAGTRSRHRWAGVTPSTRRTSAVYDHDKRSVYLMTQRIKRHPFLALFDGADPNATTAERSTTTVPTQALFFLNDPFVHAKAERCAARLLATTAERTGEDRNGLAHGTRA